MKSNTALVLYYTKPNKYSFNALVGALEANDYFNDLKIYFLDREEQLIVELQEIIDGHSKVIVGISFFTTQLWDTARIIHSLRGRYGNRPLYVTGGPHPTGDPEGTLKMGFDVVIRGEGEETFPEFLMKVDGNEDYKMIKGITYLDEMNKYHYTGRRPWVNLDAYPPFAEKHNKFGHIEITRGCPFVCYFCQTPHILGGHPRHRCIGKICEYVQKLVSRNLTDIRFITPNAFSYGSSDGKKVNLEAIEALLTSVRSVIGKNGRIFFGSFPSEVRPEHVTFETVDLVCKYADNDNLIIGAQSGSQRILDLCHRGHTLEDIYHSVEITIRAGLKANVDFIFGLPDETPKDIRYTIKVMTDLVNMGAKVHAHTFMPLPQTPFANAPAGHVSEDLRKAISRLVSKGVVYGDWDEQEKFAEQISKYLKTRILENVG